MENDQRLFFFNWKGHSFVLQKVRKTGRRRTCNWNRYRTCIAFSKRESVGTTKKFPSYSSSLRRGCCSWSTFYMISFAGWWRFRDEDQVEEVTRLSYCAFCQLLRPQTSPTKVKRWTECDRSNQKKMPHCAQLLIPFMGCTKPVMGDGVWLSPICHESD